MNSHAIDSLLKRGELVRVRRGWYAVDTEWQRLGADGHYRLVVRATAARAERDWTYSHESTASPGERLRPLGMGSRTLTARVPPIPARSRGTSCPNRAARLRTASRPQVAAPVWEVGTRSNRWQPLKHGPRDSGYRGPGPDYSRRVAPKRWAARSTPARRAALASAAVSVRSSPRKRSAKVSDFCPDSIPAPR